MVWLSSSTKIRLTYQRALSTASNNATSSTSAEQALWRRKRELYSRKVEAIPKPEILNGQFNTRVQVLAAIPVALFKRNKAARLAFWCSKWYRDVLASQYAPFRSIVDVRRLTEDGDLSTGQREYATMWGNRFAGAADYLHTLFFYHRSVRIRFTVDFSDVQIRATATKTAFNIRDDTYKLIRDIHINMGFGLESVYGTWTRMCWCAVCTDLYIPSLKHKRE